MEEGSWPLPTGETCAWLAKCHTHTTRASTPLHEVDNNQQEKQAHQMAKEHSNNNQQTTKNDTSKKNMNVNVAHQMTKAQDKSNQQMEKTTPKKINMRVARRMGVRPHDKNEQ
jgi:hypothetical protein